MSRVSVAKRGRYELIQVTCAEIILIIFKAYDNIFLIPFTILQVKSDQNVVHSSLLFMSLTLTDNQ